MKRKSKAFHLILIAAVLILVYSIESLLLAKDVELYRRAVEQGLVENLENYVSIHMIQYFLHVAIPVVTALFFFFLGKRSSRWINGIFTLLLFAGMAFRVLEFQLYSPFYYGSLVLYLFLLIRLHIPDRTPATEAL